QSVKKHHRYASNKKKWLPLLRKNEKCIVFLDFGTEFDGIFNINSKRMNKTILTSFFILLFALPTVAFAQTNVTDDVVAAFNSGYSDGIANHLNNNVELTIDQVDNVFNKQQTRTILSSFFKKNQPLKFTVMHKGDKDRSQFMIGNLETTTGRFRVSVLIKNDLIQQLRIENADD
ncbi:MAG: DUF4783 domain-containing protein, partial [Paludibacteraceae bacterium]